MGGEESEILKGHSFEETQYLEGELAWMDSACGTKFSTWTGKCMTNVMRRSHWRAVQFKKTRSFARLFS